MSADQHDIGMRLRHSRGNSADAHFGYELDRNARLRIDVLEIVDQLRKILDRIDVMMRRRRNQADRIASSANVTLMAPLQRSIRCRVIGRANWLSKLARWAGLWAGRALHSPSRP